MSVYNLNDVINECIREHAQVQTISRGLTMNNKESIYKGSMAAMNAWIESRLCKRKGAELPMLGAFTWETKFSGDGRTFSRPIFVMSESFIKDNKVRRQRIHSSPDIVKAEEINYSKLAIKYSKNLTKDMIFAGSRDILKKVGDFCLRGFEFEVEFSFGTLRCKERKVRFDFNQGRLAAILPETLRIGTLPQEEPVYDADAESTISGNQGGSQADGSGNGSGLQLSARMHSAPTRLVPTLQLNMNKPFSAASAGGSSYKGKLPAISSSTSGARGDESGRNSPIQSREVTAGLAAKTAAAPSPTSSGTEASDFFKADDVYIPPADRPLSPRLLEIMQEMEASLNAPPADKLTLRNKAKARVDEQAYLRSLAILETEAKDQERISREADAQAEDFEHHLRSEVESFHSKTKTINRWLTEQMAVNKAARDAVMDEKRRFQGSFFLPANAGNVLMPSGSLPGGQHKAAIKEGLRRDLKYQIRHNMERKETEKAQKTLEEREYLDHIAMEMDLDAIEDRAKHLQQQKILLESWERDAHVRNLKKLQQAGTNAVREYVAINLPDAQDAATGKVRTGFTSVGYDTRRGKV